MKKRMGSLDNVIDVCDREADMYEYLDYQLKQNLSELIETLEPCDTYSLHIPQKGGRPARNAEIALSYTPVTLKTPQRAIADADITLNMIVCKEVATEDIKTPLRWVIYTSEPINTPSEARQIVRYYELRWRIEEFHKVWKSEGTQVEKLRMQSRDNLRRVAIIQAFIAVRLFQLRELAQNREEAKEIPCTTYFDKVSWKILWKAIHKTKPFPDTPPSLHWGYYALAKLGRWHDSKRNGRCRYRCTMEWLVTTHATSRVL